MLKFFNTAHQADITFLTRSKLKTAVGVFLRNGNDQSKVGLNQLFFSLLRFILSNADGLKRYAQRLDANMRLLLDPLNAFVEVVDTLKSNFRIFWR